MTTMNTTVFYTSAVAAALCGHDSLRARLDVLWATKQVAEIAKRIGLLEGHLQCRDFTVEPWAKQNIETELAEKKALLETIIASL